MGDCEIGFDSDERPGSAVQVLTGAALYVAGDLSVRNLLVARGAEVHCGGTLTVVSRLEVDASGFCSAAAVVQASRKHPKAL
jgi:hypothetical protein